MSLTDIDSKTIVLTLGLRRELVAVRFPMEICHIMIALYQQGKIASCTHSFCLSGASIVLSVETANCLIARINSDDLLFQYGGWDHKERAKLKTAHLAVLPCTPKT